MTWTEDGKHSADLLKITRRLMDLEERILPDMETRILMIKENPEYLRQEVNKYITHVREYVRLHKYGAEHKE